MKKQFALVSLMLTLVIGLCGFIGLTAFADENSTEPTEKVLYDGSSLTGGTANTPIWETGANPTADTFELTTEAKYVKTGTSSILWTLNNEQPLATPEVAVHNMAMPVEEDISAYKSLKITYYVSAWADWSYFGLALHYKGGEGYDAGATTIPLNTVSEVGWNTYTVDLTAVPKKFLNLYNLFFNINMKVTDHIDMQIIVDNITLSTEEVVEVYEKQKNVLNGTTVEGMFESSVKPTADTVALTTDYQYVNTGYSSVLWNLNDEQTLIGETNAHNLVVPVNADMAEFDTIVAKFYISEVPNLEGGFFGFQLHYKEGEGYNSATTAVPFVGQLTAGWNEVTVDISTVDPKYRNLYNLFFTCNVLDVNMKDIVIAIDDITFYKTIQEEPDYSDLPDSVTVVNSETLAFLNEQVDFDTLTTTTEAPYVAEGSASSILWNISEDGDFNSGANIYAHNMVMPVYGVVEGNPADYTGYETLTVKFYVSDVDAGFNFIGLQLHNTDGAAALPLGGVVAGWNTKTFEISHLNLKLFNVFFTVHLTTEQARDMVIAVDSVVFNKTPGFNGEYFSGKEEQGADWILTDSGAEVDSLTYSTDWAMENEGSYVWNIVKEGAPIIEVANIYVHNIVLPVNKDLGKFNQLELVFYVSDWDGFSYFGLQLADTKCYDGSGTGAVGIALADMLGITPGWNKVTLDLTIYKKRLDMVNIFWTVNLTPEQHRDMSVVINSIKFSTVEAPANFVEDLDNKVVYDGSTLLNCDKVGTDSTELTTEYVQTGDSALKFNITKEATNGHNIVVPVNANCAAYNQLDVTMYVSDWSEFTYFGWQLHHKGEGVVQGGLVFQTIFTEGVPAGGAWVTFTYDITDFDNALNLYNLFFTINFVQGKEIDMFIVVDNVTFRMVETPVTGYSVIRYEVAPSISYIKYYNLENEVEVGDVIDLSVVRVSDNKDMNPTLEVTVTLNGNAVELTDGKFTATEAGTYVAKFVAKDSSDNETTVELKFTAKAGQANNSGNTDDDAVACGGSMGVSSMLAVVAFAAVALLKKRA